MVHFLLKLVAGDGIRSTHSVYAQIYSYSNFAWLVLIYKF